MSQYAPVFELADINGGNGFRINGKAPYNYAGSSVSSGDINGDGLIDLIIGAPGEYVRGELRGATYVVFGQALGFGPVVELSDMDGDNGFQINGDVSTIYTSISTCAGDINGDGFDDIASSLYVASANGEYAAGVTYLVFGKASGFSAEFELSDLDGDNGFRLLGESAWDRSGYSVSAAGDVNGDGFDDLIVGAPGGPRWDYDVTGASYVVFGKAAGFSPELQLSDLDGDNGFKILGDIVDAGLGLSVSGAGDVNGDGFDDLIMAATYAGAVGGGYVVFGQASGFGAEIDVSSLDGANGFQINGALGESDRSLGDVAGAGDINGDGFADLIMGARRAEVNGEFVGAGYVVFGKAAGFEAELELSDLNGANGFRLNGAVARESVVQVASAGDFNGDGFDDIIVSGRNYEAEDHSAYVVFGKSGGFDAEIELSDLDGDNGFKIHAGPTDISAWRSVSSAGDVNADGFDDLMVGMEFSAPNGNQSGTTYIIYGSAPGEAAERIGSVIGQTIRGGDFGDTLSGLGGDDVLVGVLGGDLLLGGDGDDMLHGGRGFDVASFAAAGNGVTVDLGISGVQTTGEGDDYLGGVEGLIGSAFGDQLTGDHRRNLLDGGDGGDTLAGGGNGDTLIGGLGADVFVFNKIADSSPRRDRISDLEDGDIIDLSAIDADISTLDDDAFTLVRQFTGHAGEARIGYSVKRDISFLNLDVDGDGHADMTIILDGRHRGFEGFEL